jgi:peptide/nickel transport system permease protein
MLRLLLYRLTVMIPMFVGVTLVTFILVSLTPGDPAVAVLGQSATSAQLAQLRQQLGLDLPLPVQYWDWLIKALRGNLGTSVFSSQTVLGTIDARLPSTLSLAALALIVTAVLGVGLGIASTRSSRLIARCADFFSLLGFAVPNFWLALLLVYLVGVKLQWLPATGYVAFSASPAGWIESLILPTIALSLGGIAAVAKQTRDALSTALSSDYIRVLRANGASERSLLYRHALKNAAIPVVTVLGLLTVGLVSGVVVIEQVFAIPGVGSLAVQVTNEHDLPMLQGIVVYFVLMVMAINLVLDLAYGWLNPQARV